MSKKAQASAEYVILIAMLLAVLTVVIVIFFNIYGQLKAQTNFHLVRNFAFELSESAKKVYHEGIGARKILFFNIPSFAINFSASKIQNRTIVLNTFDFGDIYKTLDFDIEGYFLQNQTQGYFLIENTGSTVKIYPATNLYVSKPSFYFNSSLTDQTIEIKNYGQINLTLTQTIVLPSCPSCNYNDSGTNILQPYQSRIGKLSTGSLLPGIYNGYLKIEAKNNFNYANHTIFIPITIEIS